MYTLLFSNVFRFIEEMISIYFLSIADSNADVEVVEPKQLKTYEVNQE